MTVKERKKIYDQTLKVNERRSKIKQQQKKWMIDKQNEVEIN